jgi:protein SCO1/2
MTRYRVGRLGLAMFGVLASLLLTACTGGSSSGGSPITVNSPPSQSAFRGAVVSPGLTLPSVSLTDTSGRTWNLAAKARGRVTAVYFGYTNCPDVCPTDMADLATARRSLAPELRAKVDIVFITVDQKRDTRPVIRTWLDRFDTALVGLTGTTAQLAAAAHALHVPYRATTTAKGLEQVEHGSQMTAFAPDGVSRLIWLDGTAVGDIANDLRLLASGQVPD